MPRGCVICVFPIFVLLQFHPYSVPQQKIKGALPLFNFVIISAKCPAGATCGLFENFSEKVSLWARAWLEVKVKLDCKHLAGRVCVLHSHTYLELCLKYNQGSVNIKQKNGSSS